MGPTMKQHTNPLIRVRQANLNRYRRLLETQLTETERAYIERRIAEEQEAIERLARHAQSADISTVVAAHALATDTPDHQGS
jgi:precorrin-2 methylase